MGLIAIMVIILTVTPIVMLLSANAGQVPPPDLHPGDIIQARWDKAEPKCWNMHYWTHTLLYIGDTDAGFNVVHSTPSEGVHLGKLSECIEDCDNWAILRVFEDPIDGDAVIVFAMDKENDNRPFDYRSLILPRKQINGHWPFVGYGYYCTELVWASYLSGVGIDLDDNGFSWINPLELYYSSCITEKWTEHPELVPIIIY